jgi:hypothetical protein
MAMQLKAWMTTILFYKWISHFITFIQAHGRNLYGNNRHLLLLNGHNYHVTLEVMHMARSVGLDWNTLPSCMSHAL